MNNLMFLALASLLLGADAEWDSLTARWQEVERLAKSPAFSSAPLTTAPYSPGLLSTDMESAALKLVNLARAVAGIADDVKIDPSLRQDAQIGATLMAAAGAMDHEPTRPPGMSKDFYRQASETLSQCNISSATPPEKLTKSIMGMLFDDDKQNASSLGHRRWILNPYMRVTGFGYATSAANTQSFSAMFAFDQSRENTPAFEYVAWPSPKRFPIEFVSRRMPWVVCLNDQIFEAPDSAVVITLSDGGKSWTFRPKTDAQAADEGFGSISKSSYGLQYALIFRPTTTHFWKTGEEANVIITGLQRKAGGSGEIRFTTKFLAFED
jgi:uncharacterized protein YkwD